MPESEARVNSMNINGMAPPLDPELAKEMLECLGEMPTEQRCDFASATIELIQFLEKKYPDAFEDRFRDLTSFSLRYMALNGLRKRPEYRSWSLKIGKGGDDPDVIHEVIVETAAVHPLTTRNKHPTFNPAKFFRAALERAEAMGEA
jgi:hypothetical protein